MVTMETVRYTRRSYFYCFLLLQKWSMGRRKFRLCVIKNAERKLAQQRSLMVSIPRSCVNICVAGKVIVSAVPEISQLIVKLRSQALKAPWVIAAEAPLTICKMAVPLCGTPTAMLTISILETLHWTASAFGTAITVDALPQLSKAMVTLCSVEAVHQLIDILDSSKMCIGSPDADLVQQWSTSSPTLHSCEGIILTAM